MGLDRAKSGLLFLVIALTMAGVFVFIARGPASHEPVPVGSVEKDPDEPTRADLVAVDGASVYVAVASTGDIDARPRTGGAARRTLARRQRGVVAIEVDDAYVYWAVGGEAGRMRRVPKDGGAVETIARDASTERPETLAFSHGGATYEIVDYDDAFDTQPLGAATVWASEHRLYVSNGSDGGAPTLLADFEPARITAMRCTDDSVYVATTTSEREHRIVRARAGAATAIDVVATTRTAIEKLVVDSDQLFWAEGGVVYFVSTRDASSRVGELR
jgi:hypothetical protein